MEAVVIIAVAKTLIMTMMITIAIVIPKAVIAEAGSSSRLSLAALHPGGTFERIA